MYWISVYLINSDSGELLETSMPILLFLTELKGFLYRKILENPIYWHYTIFKVKHLSKIILD